MEERVIFHGHTLHPTGTTVPCDLLSPANASGFRGKRLLSGRAHFDLALRLRTAGASLGDILWKPGGPWVT